VVLLLVKPAKHRGSVILILSYEPFGFLYPRFLEGQDDPIGKVCNSTPYIREPHFTKTCFGILNVIHGQLSFELVIVGSTLAPSFDEVVVLIQEGALRG